MILFKGMQHFGRKAAMRDVFAGVNLASMNIPQVLGYARIAGMPVVTGLYTVLLPLVAFAVFGSSRHLIVAADSATAVIFSGPLSRMAVPASEKYVALVGMVALLTAGLLFLAWIFRLGFLADFLSRTVLIGFLTGVGFQVGIAMLGDMLGVPSAPTVRCVQAMGGPARSAGVQPSDIGAVRAGGRQHPARQARRAANSGIAVRGGRDDRGERGSISRNTASR